MLSISFLALYRLLSRWVFLYSYHAHDRCIDEGDIIIELSFTDSGIISEKAIYIREV